MSIEAQVFLLRLGAALSLLGVLLTLFYLVMRAARESASAPAQSRAFLRQAPAADAAGERFALQPITTIGRSPANTISIDDDFVSAMHAQIALSNGLWWLEDWGSRNGTRLNDELVARPVALAHGDVIGIGRAQYRLEIAE